MSAQPRWDHTGQQASRPVAVQRNEVDTASDRNAARILTVAALASIAAGGIHVAAASTLGDNDGQTLAFFGAVAAAEIVWGLVALFRAPRWWLVLGVLGNAAVVATWIVSRTVGLPVGEFAHEVLPVGYADVLATIFGAVTIIGALGVSGIVSQANAFSGGGGQNVPGAPTGGGAYGGYGGSGNSGSTGGVT